MLGWFVLGFAFYASLFAAAGSLVSRMEELQNVIVPLNLVILVSFFISIGAARRTRTRTLAVVASLLPFSSALGDARADRPRIGHPSTDRAIGGAPDRVDDCC